MVIQSFAGVLDRHCKGFRKREPCPRHHDHHDAGDLLVARGSHFFFDFWGVSFDPLTVSHF